MSIVKQYKEEILEVWKEANLYYPLKPAPEYLDELLRARGLCIMPVPERQVYDVEQLVEASEIVSIQSRIAKTQASDVFTKLYELVGIRNQKIDDYCEKYGNEKS